MPYPTGANQIILPGATDVTTLLSNATTVSQISPVATAAYRLAKVVRAFVTGGGNASVQVFGNTRESTTNGVLLGTITLNPSTPVDAFAFDAPFPYVYVVLAGVSGGAVTVDFAG